MIYITGGKDLLTFLFITILPDAKKIKLPRVLHTSCDNANRLYGVKQSLTISVFFFKGGRRFTETLLFLKI